MRHGDSGAPPSTRMARSSRRSLRPGCAASAATACPTRSCAPRSTRARGRVDRRLRSLVSVSAQARAATRDAARNSRTSSPIPRGARLPRRGKRYGATEPAPVPRRRSSCRRPWRLEAKRRARRTRTSRRHAKQARLERRDNVSPRSSRLQRHQFRMASRPSVTAIGRATTSPSQRDRSDRQLSLPEPERGLLERGAHELRGARARAAGGGTARRGRRRPRARARQRSARARARSRPRPRPNPPPRARPAASCGTTMPGTSLCRRSASRWLVSGKTPSRTGIGHCRRAARRTRRRSRGRRRSASSRTSRRLRASAGTLELDARDRRASD